VSAYGKGNKFYIGDFDDELPEIFPKVIRATREQAEIDGGHLEFYINSFGGHAHDAQTLVSLMEIAKNHGLVVRTIVTGVAYSSGSYVSVAGSEGERYMTRAGRTLLHYGFIGAYASTPTEADREHAYMKSWLSQTVNHYAEYTKLSKEELKEYMDHDSWFLDFNKSKRYGICDKPLDKFYLAK
jgi:ATP-dependent protease ClpP protease subunit